MYWRHIAQRWVYWQHSNEVSDNEPFTRLFITAGGQSSSSVRRGHSPARGSLRGFQGEPGKASLRDRGLGDKACLLVPPAHRVLLAPFPAPHLWGFTDLFLRYLYYFGGSQTCLFINHLRHSLHIQIPGSCPIPEPESLGQGFSASY